MPDEDKNFGGSLVLVFRKLWRHVKTIHWGTYSTPNVGEMDIVINLFIVSITKAIKIKLEFWLISFERKLPL